MTEQEKVSVLNKLGIFGNYKNYTIVDKGDEYEVFTGQSDIKGCVLVGSAMADINKDGILDIVNSKPTFAGLMLMFPDGFELTIKS